ncbi:MAG: hypothetical protein ACRD12_05110 [Acidimicrobiales bacterium]
MNDPLCEVCSKPMPSGSKPLRVGACEFPFHVHDECQEAMGPLANEIAFICSAADEQPEGLLWLGSWDAAPEPTEVEPGTGDSGR